MPIIVMNEEEAVLYFVECYKSFILELGLKWDSTLFLGESAYSIQKQIIKVAVFNGLLFRGDYVTLYNKEPEGLVKKIYEYARSAVK